METYTAFETESTTPSVPQRMIRSLPRVFTVGAVLLALAAYDYAYFRAVVEIFSVVVAVSVLTVAWNGRRLLDNDYLLLIGLAYLYYAIDAIPHILSAPQFGLFPGFGPDLPDQIYLVQRLVLASAFLVAPVFLRRRLPVPAAVAALTLASVIPLSSLLLFRTFPAVLVPGDGFTAFKLGAEAVISAMFLGSAVLLYRDRRFFDPAVGWMLISVAIAFIVSEAFYSVGGALVGPFDLLGSLAQTLAFYLTYKAVVETAYTHPYTLLFRQLAERERTVRLAQQQAQEQLQKTRLLLAAADALAAVTDLDGLLRALGDIVLEATGRRRIMIILWDPVRSELVVASSAGKDPVEPGRVVPWEKMSTGMRDAVMRDRTSVIDYDALPVQERGPGTEFDMRLALEVPLLYHGALMGLIGVDDPGERHEFSEQEADIVEGIAVAAAVAIQNARLFAREKDAVRFADALNRINEAVHSTLRVEETYRRVVDEATTVMECDACAFGMTEDGAWAPRYSRGRLPEIVGRRFPMEDVPFVEAAAETGQPLAIEDVSEDERLSRGEWLQWDLPSVLVVPLEEQGRPIAAVLFGYVSPHRFSDAQLDFARKFAASVSLALENARLFDNLRETEIRFRATFDYAAAGLVLGDLNGLVVDSNPAFDEMLGYAHGEARGKPISDFSLIEDTVAEDRLLGELLAGERDTYRIEKRYIRSDGGQAWGSLSSSLVRSETGEPLFVIAVIEDISERKRSEEALREKDLAIREAYSDVIDAVTGGKLVLMTAEEVAEALGDAVVTERRLETDRDLSEARNVLRQAFQSAHPPPRVIDEYVLAASETLTNALKYGHGGEYSVRRTRNCFQVVVSDFGPGIDFRNLPKATLVPGFSTQTSLGMGFTIMLDVADRVLLATQPSLTVVVLEVETAETPAPRTGAHATAPS